MVDDISHLDFDVPNDIVELEQTISTAQEPAKTAAIVTSISDLELMAAVCVISEFRAIVTPNGVFGSCSFLEKCADGAPEKAIERLTREVNGLDAVLVQYKMGRIETTLWRSGKAVETLIPTLVIGNLSAAAEDALIGELNLFDLIASGEYKVDDNKARESLPSNYIPKKYQPQAPQSVDEPNDIVVIDSGLISEDRARKILSVYENKEK
jgi:hypothetical protein